MHLNTQQFLACRFCPSKDHKIYQRFLKSETCTRGSGTILPCEHSERRFHLRSRLLFEISVLNILNILTQTQNVELFESFGKRLCWPLLLWSRHVLIRVVAAPKISGSDGAPCQYTSLKNYRSFQKFRKSSKYKLRTSDSFFK